MSVQFITKVALAGCLVTALLCSVVLVGGNALIGRLELVPIEFRTDGRTGGNRIDIWHATWRSIKAHPFVGTGFGAYGVAITAHHDASGKWVPQQAHNDYLELIASGGLIGGMLGIWFAVIFIKRAFTRLRSADPFQCAACLGALAGIFAIAIHSLFDFGLHVNTNALMFFAFVVIATARVKEAPKGRGLEVGYRTSYFNPQSSGS